MAFDPNQVSSQKKAEGFFRFAWLGLGAYLIGTGIALVGGADDGPVNLLAAIAALVLFVSLIRMFQLRRGDEYVLRLWGSATSAAFITLVAVSLVSGLADGFIDGFRGASPNRPAGFLATSDVPEIATMLVFFGTVILQRLRP